MQVEVKTRAHVNRKGKAEVLLQLLLVPRGSGNRRTAQRLAKSFRDHPIMKPHITKVVCGCSAVTVHLRSSLAMLQALAETMDQEKAKKDVKGQMRLWGSVQPA